MASRLRLVKWAVAFFVVLSLFVLPTVGLSAIGDLVAPAEVVKPDWTKPHVYKLVGATNGGDVDLALVEEVETMIAASEQSAAVEVEPEAALEEPVLEEPEDERRVAEKRADRVDKRKKRRKANAGNNSRRTTTTTKAPVTESPTGDDESTPTTTEAPTTTQTPTTTEAPTTTTTKAPPTTTTTTAPPTTTTTNPPNSGSVDRLWSDSSPLNVRIPSNPKLDPDSKRMINAISDGVIADLYEYGIRIVTADSSTPKARVTCSANWGTCAPERESPIRIPSDTEPPPGTDGNTAIVDYASKTVWSMWQPHQNSNGSWTATWGAMAKLNGDGIAYPNGGNGAGFSHAAGVVTIKELKAGRIEHALVFSTNNACSGEFRYPAAKSDGNKSTSDCIPEGSRVQLDPSINVDKLDAPRGVKIVAKAMQEYGAYVVDNGGAEMALYFQVAPDARSGYPGKVYVDNGLDRDYVRLEGVPWNRLRVLNSWNGK